MLKTVGTKSLDFKKVTLTDFQSAILTWRRTSVGQYTDNRLADLQKDI